MRFICTLLFFLSFNSWTQTVNLDFNSFVKKKNLCLDVANSAFTGSLIEHDLNEDEYAKVEKQLVRYYGVVSNILCKFFRA